MKTPDPADDRQELISRRFVLLAAAGALVTWASGTTLSRALFPIPTSRRVSDEEMRELRLANRPPLLNPDVQGLLKEHLGGQVRKGSAPQIGAVEYGGFMEEAFRSIGISGASRSHFHQLRVGRQGYSLGMFGFEESPDGDLRRSNQIPILCRYGLYRKQVAAVYGAPLADANYMSFNGETNPKVAMARAYELGLWIAEAAAFGEPVVGIQLDDWRGKMGWELFQGRREADLHPELAAFRDMALCLQEASVRFSVRFLSEAEMVGSPYSCTRSPERFADSIRFFRRWMPENVSVVYSPSCASSSRAILSLLGNRREPLPFDIFGGTLYSSVNGSLEEIYGRFHASMRSALGPMPFQVCELGAPLSRKEEVRRFLRAAEKGAYAGLSRINLFGARLNKESVSQKRLGPYGFLDEGAPRSYLHPHLSSTS